MEFSGAAVRWQTAPMRSRLLVIGLLLLGVSLLLTVVSLTTDSYEGMRATIVLSWFSSATLYVGAALTAAGAVLHELRRPEPVGPPDPVDYYG